MLFISWLLRWIYAPIVRKIFHQDVHPYTAKRFKTLAQKVGFSFENYTRWYVNKMRNISYIGNTMVAPWQNTEQALISQKPGFLKFLEPFGVLVFVCRKVPEKTALVFAHALSESAQICLDETNINTPEQNSPVF
jgi:hypothetical protein